MFLFLCFSSLLIYADTIDLPLFFDPKERFEKPNLASMAQFRFLTTVDFPPFHYIGPNNILIGYHIDLVRALCRELQIETICQIEALPWEELTGELHKNRGEMIIAGLAPNPDNLVDLVFSRAYMRFPARFMTLRSIEPLPILSTIAQKKVGVIQHSAHEALLASYFPTLMAQNFPDEEQLYTALKEKKIDLIFGDAMRFSLWLNSSDSQQCCQFITKSDPNSALNPYSGYYLAPNYLGDGLRIVALQKNASLISAMNYALQSLERQGILKELYLRYFPIGFY